MPFVSNSTKRDCDVKVNFQCEIVRNTIEDLNYIGTYCKTFILVENNYFTYSELLYVHRDQ